MKQINQNIIQVYQIENYNEKLNPKSWFFVGHVAVDNYHDRDVAEPHCLMQCVLLNQGKQREIEY